MFSFIVSPLQERDWLAYEAFFADRSRPLPPREGCEAIGVFGEGLLIAACGLYETTGPFVLVEGVAVDPCAPLRQRHAALENLLYEIRRISFERNRTLVGSSSVAGLVAIAKRAGICAGPATALASNVERLRGRAA